MEKKIKVGEARFVMERRENGFQIISKRRRRRRIGIDRVH